MDISNTIDEMKICQAGDHMVLLYEDDDYNTDIIAAYIVSRLVKNEKCFYISGDSDVELLLEKVSVLTDIDKYRESGQFLLLSKDDAYSKGPRFEPDNMIALLKKLALEAIDEGYKAFAITGEIGWVLEYESGFEKIMDYEYKLNKYVFGDYPVSAVCRYNLNTFSSEMIKSIIEVHPMIIWKGRIHDNPFYIESVDGEAVDISQYQVESMLDIITSFTNTASDFNLEMQKKEEEYHRLQRNLTKNIIITLTGLLEIHDKYTKSHSENVAKFASKIAKALGLSSEEVTKIFFAGLVHDIGKTVIPAEIINKTEQLTDEEFKIIKKHSKHGYDALIRTKELNEIAEIVLQHHEKYDGTGYPNGIDHRETLIGGRILQVADAYDAMVNDRPYHKAKSKEEAIGELKRCSGTQFDPIIVETFIALGE